METKVTAIDGADIWVEAIIFYALSGGQESDAGSIAGCPVVQARKEGKEIIYTLAEQPNLNVGDKVWMTIDWQRLLHFAAEIALALVYEKLGDVERIGCHIAENKSRIDFSGRPISAANYLSWKNKPIKLLKVTAL